MKAKHLHCKAQHGFKPEYVFLQDLKNACVKDGAFSGKCTAVQPKLSTKPEEGIVKPAWWRVDVLVLEGKLGKL